MFAESVAGYIPADVKIPVIVWYNPAGIHSSGRFFFYEDIYEKFHWMKFAFVSHVAFVKLTIIIINIEQGHRFSFLRVVYLYHNIERTKILLSNFSAMNIRPIIIVEDDEDDAEFLANAFIETGAQCKCRCFSSPVAALKYLKTTAELPLAIISDINMPLINGLEFKRLINEGKLLEGKAIPFIFLSTSVNMRFIREAYHLSVQGFFKKPNTITGFDIIAKSIVDYCGNNKSPKQMAC